MKKYPNNTPQDNFYCLVVDNKWELSENENNFFAEACQNNHIFQRNYLVNIVVSRYELSREHYLRSNTSSYLNSHKKIQYYQKISM